MTKTTGGESTIISPSSPRSGSIQLKGTLGTKSTRKPLSKAKPQRSSSFKSHSKSTLKPVIVKSQLHDFLLMLRDAIEVESPPHTEKTQLDILRGAKEYILYLQQLIQQDDEQQIVVNKLDDLSF